MALADTTPPWPYLNMANFLRSTDAGYDAELAGFNTAFAQRPDVVVPAETEADVVDAVTYARDNGLTVGVLATGHGTHEEHTGGLLINVSRLADVTIDESSRTATIGGGARWAAVVAAASQHGLAPVTGSSTNVGVVGFLLGGGLGPISRSHGFGSDWVRGYRLVTASGEVVVANNDENPELFWALRGGKGGFGVVTQVTIELLDLPTLYGGVIVFDEAHIEQATRAWIDYTASAPADVTTSIFIVNFPPLEFIPEVFRGRRLLMVRFAYPGDSATGAELAAPVRDFAPIYVDAVRELNASELALIHNDPTDPGPGWGLGGLLNDLDQDFATALLTFIGPGTQVPFIGAEVRQIGEATRVDVPEGSAVGGRASGFTLHLLGAPDPALFEIMLPALGAGFLDSIEKWVSPETTINFADSADPAAFREAWPEETFARLASIRASIDPDGLFPYGPHA